MGLGNNDMLSGKEEVKGMRHLVKMKGEFERSGLALLLQVIEDLL